MKEQGVDSLVQGTQVFRRGVMRGISCVVMTTYLTLVAAPAAAALRQEVFARPKPLTENSIAQSELAQMREAMRQHRLEQQLAARAPETTTDKLKALFTDSPKVKTEKALVETLLGARERLQAEATRQDAEMAGTRADLVRKRLPDVILARHDAAVQTIAQRRAEFMGQLDQLQQSVDDDARRSALLDSIDQKLEAWGGKQQARTDYKHLPWGSPDSKVRAPHASQLAYLMNLEMFGIKPLRLAGPMPAGTVLPVLPKLPSTPQAGDLAETEDIQLTPAIRAKAAELNHNPVAIYRWVHDNIEYIPTYGSIQGADYALQTKRGNAFDTSSLVIGLLRASGIPARYVYGTVEVPMDKAMNWVGGVTHPNAVLELMGQGGIPNIGLTMGGKLVAVRMEHVWVEAFVDFVPSRGVKNRVPDTWVPMDASYKQYAFVQAANLAEAVPFNSQQLISEIQQGSVIDLTSGYVQNVDQAKIRTALSSYQSQVQTYLENTAAPGSLNVLGSKTILPDRAGALNDVLPLKLTAVAGDFQSLPESMRHYFTYGVSSVGFGSSVESGSFDVRLSLPRLSGRMLALSFRPSTADDDAALRSFLPTPHADGTPIDPREFPTSAPGYLVSVVPELTIDGEVVAAGESVMMGSDLSSSASIISPNSSLNGVVSVNLISAGEYHAIAVDHQGLTGDSFARLQVRVEDVKQKVLLKDVDSLTRHTQTGIVLQAGAYTYFAVNDIEDYISSMASGLVSYRLPSYGSLSTTLETVYSWGVPREVRSAGVTMDMDRITSVLSSKDGSLEKVRAWRVDSGFRMSANEHHIPELVLGGEGEVNGGVSAVRAIQVAALEGQKIFMINGSNLNQVIGQLFLSQEVKAEISNAVSAGFQVATSQRNVSFGGWSGAGYIIFDPATGAGAYKISGGQNGARKIWDGVLAGFSGMLDGLLKTYRAPNSMFGPDSERLWSNKFNAMAKILNVIALVRSIGDTLMDDTLSTTQKVAKIFLTAAFTIATLNLGTFSATLLGPAFINPVGAVLLSITVVFLVSFLTAWLIDAVVAYIAGLRMLVRRFSWQVA